MVVFITHLFRRWRGGGFDTNLLHLIHAVQQKVKPNQEGRRATEVNQQ
jgi:hypothetical protein